MGANSTGLDYKWGSDFRGARILVDHLHRIPARLSRVKRNDHMKQAHSNSLAATICLFGTELTTVQGAVCTLHSKPATIASWPELIRA